MSTKHEAVTTAYSLEAAKEFAAAWSSRSLAMYVVLLSLLTMMCGRLRGQGCVQSRGAGTCMLMPGEELYLQPGQWQAAVGYRWFHADSPFIGGVEQKQTEAAHTQAINDQHFIDVTASYGLTKRLSLNLIIPFVSSTRSSFTDHFDGPQTNITREIWHLALG